MRAWWSVLLVPKRRTHLHSRYDCSLLCFEEPTQKVASGPDSALIFFSLSAISVYAWSQEIFFHLPPSSFTGYFRRCESWVMPCSRIEAPLAQCAPRLRGESNPGSWRTHTPFCTTASMAQPTEQCVQTVRLTSTLPVASSFACASPIMLNGSCEATATLPAPTPERFRKVRRSMVLARTPESPRDKRDWGTALEVAFLVSSMTGLLRPSWCGSSCSRARWPGSHASRACLYCRMGIAKKASSPRSPPRLRRRRRRRSEENCVWIAAGCGCSWGLLRLSVMRDRF